MGSYADDLFGNELIGRSVLDRLNRIFPLPYPHSMAFAPLDAWARVLFGRGGISDVPPRFWPRLAFALAISAVSTVLTLPERVVLGVILAGRMRARSAKARPPRKRVKVVCVLGYFRSGTTHLHYLLSCDPNFVTPRWHQMLAPQGFVVSWALLRWALIPFLSSTRPQDDVAYGPEYPAEDDFGLCNWAGIGTLPGRVIVPRAWERFKRYQTLDGLSPRELERFCRVQWSIVEKIGMLRGWTNGWGASGEKGRERMVLLKSPPHTARVAELRALFGDDVRFIHVHRDQSAVLKSNIAMHDRLGVLMVQPHPGRDEVRRRVIEEYDATERAFIAQSAAVPGDRLVRLRYEDVIADPIGEMRRAYERLGLEHTPECAARAVTYLESVRAYRSASQKAVDGEAKGAVVEDNAPELDWMTRAFGHDAPPIAKREPRERAIELGLLSDLTRVDEPGLLNGWTAGLAAMMAGMAAWSAAALATGDRLDWLLWPLGLSIGLSVLRSAKRGSAGLGVWSAVLTLLAACALAFPLSWLTEYVLRDPVPWDHVWLTTRRNFFATNTMVWLILGVMTAYRAASRVHLRPPGM